MIQILFDAVSERPAASLPGAAYFVVSREVSAQTTLFRDIMEGSVLGSSGLNVQGRAVCAETEPWSPVEPPYIVRTF